MSSNKQKSKTLSLIIQVAIFATAIIITLSMGFPDLEYRDETSQGYDDYESNMQDQSSGENVLLAAMEPAHQCDYSGDCPQFHYCDRRNKPRVCRPIDEEPPGGCSSSKPCPEGKACLDGECVSISCASDQDCEPGEICYEPNTANSTCIRPTCDADFDCKYEDGFEGVCRYPGTVYAHCLRLPADQKCTTDADCAPSGRYCHPSHNYCTECVDDTQCPPGNRCGTTPLLDRGICQCSDDSGCTTTPATPICISVSLQDKWDYTTCVECGKDSDCRGSKPACNNRRCNECKNSDDSYCPADKPACGDHDYCDQCKNSDDKYCPVDKPACSSNSCWECKDDNDKYCPADKPACSVHSCWECKDNDNSYCPEDRPICKSYTCYPKTDTNPTVADTPTPTSTYTATPMVTEYPNPTKSMSTSNIS